MLTQTPTDTLVLNTAIDISARRKTFLKHGMPLQKYLIRMVLHSLWLVFFGCDVLKLIH